MALEAAKFSPPSENELSVTFRMPMTRVRSVGKSVNVLRVALRITDRGPVAGPVPGTAPIDMGKSFLVDKPLPGLVYPGVQNQTHGLITGRWLTQLTAHRRCDRLCMWFLYPAHRHTHVLRRDHHDGPGRIQVAHNCLNNLGRQTFLYLRTTRIEFHQPRQLGRSEERRGGKEASTRRGAEP